jgi:hypothetical protein
MLKKLATIASMLIALSASAVPVELTNTAGTVLTVEIDAFENGKVTIKRVSDSKEFTIPLSMLDEASQAIVTEWVKETVYNPDTYPFILAEDEYVIPVKILNSTSIEAIDASGATRTFDFNSADLLAEFVARNNVALQTEPQEAFTGIMGERDWHSKGKFMAFQKDRITVLSGEMLLMPAAHWPADSNPPADAFLDPAVKMWKITYRTFFPKDLRRYTLGRTESILNPISPSFQQAARLRIGLDAELPTAQKGGQWVTHKTYVRTFPKSCTRIVFHPDSHMPYTIRDFEMKPVDLNPKMVFYTTQDLEDYNIFTSTGPVEISKSGSSYIYSGEDYYLKLPMDLETGFDVKMEFQLENARIKTKESMNPEECDLRIRKESGSRDQFTVTYKTPKGALLDPVIEIHPVDKSKPLVIHTLKVSASFNDDAKENPYL